MADRAPRRIPEPIFDLSYPRRCHVVGVGGPGMGAIAIFLAERGHMVSGSDMRDLPSLSASRAAGVTVTVGHSESVVDGVDAVTYSTAVPLSNIEVSAAMNSGTRVMHRAAMLASICANEWSVGIAGTHGKTTTSALLATMLRGADRDVSFIIGADVLDTGSGAHAGKDDVLVVEADESDGTAEVLPLRALLLTNIDQDHLDYFSDLDEMEESFLSMAQRTDGPVVLCIDDPRCRRIAAHPSLQGRVVTYGTWNDADVHVSSVVTTPSGLDFAVASSHGMHQVSLPLRGAHNAVNCAGALAMAIALGVPARVAAASVADFGGVDRRFAERGEFNGALLVDDYAHLPAEIEAVVLAAREHPRRKGRVVAVFQPNRYHRIAAMADAYADCFVSADIVAITDIYASGTTPLPGVTGKLVVDAVLSSRPQTNLIWAPSREELVAAVADALAPGDICISMGCGDIETFPADLRAVASSTQRDV